MKAYVWLIRLDRVMPISWSFISWLCLLRCFFINISFNNFSDAFSPFLFPLQLCFENVYYAQSFFFLIYVLRTILLMCNVSLIIASSTCLRPLYLLAQMRSFSARHTHMLRRICSTRILHILPFFQLDVGNIDKHLLQEVKASGWININFM